MPLPDYGHHNAEKKTHQDMVNNFHCETKFLGDLYFIFIKYYETFTRNFVLSKVKQTMNGANV